MTENTKCKKSAPVVYFRLVLVQNGFGTVGKVALLPVYPVLQFMIKFLLLMVLLLPLMLLLILL